MNKFQLSNKDWKELMKLYPEIKIPYLQEADYYIEQLGKHDDTVYKKIAWYTEVKENHEDVGGYKHSVVKEIINELSSKYLDKLNTIDLPDNSEFSEKKGPKFVPDQNYISIDLKEANYNAFKKALEINDSELPETWGEFMRVRGLPELFANSKSLRQLIMGNLNPKRQVSFQKNLMISLVKDLRSKGIEPLSISHDEVIFYKPDFAVVNDYDFKISINEFFVNYFEINGEEVIVKYQLNKKPKLYGIQGNRYFIYYSRIFLMRDPEERDLYFEPEPGKLAKWVL